MGTRRVANTPPRSRASRSELRHARLGSVLWNARGRLGLTATQMGKRLGVSAGRVLELESGKRLPNGNRLHVIADVMGVDPASLYLLRAAARVDVVFQRGGRTIEQLHRKVVRVIESEAKLTPHA